MGRPRIIRLHLSQVTRRRGRRKTFIKWRETDLHGPGDVSKRRCTKDILFTVLFWRPKQHGRNNTVTARDEAIQANQTTRLCAHTAQPVAVSGNITMSVFHGFDGPSLVNERSLMK